MNPTFFHFVLSLPDHVNYEIIRLKNEAKRVIGDYPGMASKPHITINNYPKQNTYIHDHGFSMFERRLSLLPAIVFEIDGFDCFNESNGYNKTIYARLKMADHNKYWLKLLWDIVGKSNDTPHITIARGITPEQFNILWPHFRKRELNLKFVSSRFTILKNQARSASQMYREFEFKGSADSLTDVYRDYLMRAKKSYSSVSQQISLF
jgi:2'-5' RNA ligase